MEINVSRIVIDRDTSLECNCSLSTFKTVSTNYDIIFDKLKLLKVTEQVRGCVVENHPHGRVILQKCLNLYIILKLTEPKMTWKCF